MRRWLSGGLDQHDDGRAPLVAALDVGSSKVACLIARAGTGETVDVVGFGSAPNEGVRHGAISDLAATEASIRSAVEQAERMSGANVTRVSTSFSGGGLCSRHVVGETELSDQEIGERDIRRALDAALRNFNSAGRVVLHAIPMVWTVDDCRGVAEPRGMFGSRLAVELHVISAADAPVRNLSLCLQRAHLEVRAVVAAPYASGLATLVREETELGALAIDLGAGVTTASIFGDGVVRYVDVAPLGSGHVSNDLARGLYIPLSAAEEMKCTEASLLVTPGDEEQVIAHPAPAEAAFSSQVTRATLRNIVAPRMEEIFEHVRDRLNTAGVLKSAGRRIVLTGGGSQLHGVAQLAANVFDRHVRIGTPLRVSGPWDDSGAAAYSVVAGLVRHAAERARETPAPTQAEPPRRVARLASAGGGRIAQAASWLRENF